MECDEAGGEPCGSIVMQKTKAKAKATGSDKDSICSEVVAGLPDYSRCLQNDLDGKKVSLLSKHSGLVIDVRKPGKYVSQV